MPFQKASFTPSQRILIAILTILQFTVVLDFAVMAPMGSLLMRTLEITAPQFGYLVSSYAIAAGTSGFLLAGFVDRFDRKRILLILYAGFIIGTLLCAVAPNYQFLFIARLIAGLFGGVISGVSFAVITDIFKYEQRGSVMGFVQMAFSGSQILGIPIGLYLAVKWSWHVPFYLIVGLATINWFLIHRYMKSIPSRLKTAPLRFYKVLFDVFSQKEYRMAFLTTFFLATGGFLMMPYSSPYLVFNLGIAEASLPIIFFSAGIGTLIFSPLFGRLSDAWGKFKVFLWGSVFASIMIAWYINVDYGHLGLLIFVFAGMMIFVSSRIISASAMITEVPNPEQRGAFMNINSAIQQMSGGIATIIGSVILIQNEDLTFANFHHLGWITIFTVLLGIVLMYRIHKLLENRKI